MHYLSDLLRLNAALVSFEFSTGHPRPNNKQAEPTRLRQIPLIQSESAGLYINGVESDGVPSRLSVGRPVFGPVYLAEKV